jgi:hypothetical protein
LSKSYNFCLAIAYLEETSMSICPQCGAKVSANAVVCIDCNALIVSDSNSQSQAMNDESRNVELNQRLEKAMRRTELLSYAAAGLGVATLAVIILISFL